MKKISIVCYNIKLQNNLLSTNAIKKSGYTSRLNANN